MLAAVSVPGVGSTMAPSEGHTCFPKRVWPWWIFGLLLASLFAATGALDNAHFGALRQPRLRASPGDLTVLTLSPDPSSGFAWSSDVYQYPSIVYTSHTPFVRLTAEIGMRVLGDGGQWVLLSSNVTSAAPSSTVIVPLHPGRTALQVVSVPVPGTAPAVYSLEIETPAVFHEIFARCVPFRDDCGARL